MKSSQDRLDFGYSIKDRKPNSTGGIGVDPGGCSNKDGPLLFFNHAEGAAAKGSLKGQKESDTEPLTRCLAYLKRNLLP